MVQLRQVSCSTTSREREDSISGFNSTKRTAGTTNVSIGEEPAADIELPSHLRSPQSDTVREEAGSDSLSGREVQNRPAAAAFDNGGVDSDRVPLRYP